MLFWVQAMMVKMNALFQPHKTALSLNVTETGLMIAPAGVVMVILEVRVWITM
eukprot:m.132644 g.132644  ORF g.132644 m.132644 type:complete len:53 (-) comp9488_c0_seq6:1079-1237(-)